MNDPAFDLAAGEARPATAGNKITSPSLASITDSPKEESEPRFSFQKRRDYIREWDSWRNQWEAGGGTLKLGPVKTSWLTNRVLLCACARFRNARSVRFPDTHRW